MRAILLTWAVFFLLPWASPFRAAEDDPQDVRAWTEPVVVPTYEVAPPDLNPRFYSGRVYQGAQASLYPYPVYDRLTDRRAPKTYTAVYLENEYVKLSIFPEIGGRIFSALDKTNGYDFFYRQHVIKPALIGMLGAWISGGVEWNVPHHHRATSFQPVDYAITRELGGGKTVWVGETEWRHRMRWIVGVTLRPGSSAVEMKVKIFNRTPLSHSFLFWINPGVHANDDYQVIFPPRTQFGVQHGKPEFARWPIADGRYAGIDYKGVDLSWWKNHPESVSLFAWHSDEDFFGGYDHGKQAGVLHVANHHVVPGKKFFLWGKGPQGDLWTEILTDEDGPYLELMAGAYSDNQPDYSWCQSAEVKIFEHTWYPIRGMGGVKNANTEAAVNLEVTNKNTARIACNTTSRIRQAQVVLETAGRELFRKQVTLSPAQPFSAEVPLQEGQGPRGLKVSISDEGRELIAYRLEQGEKASKPKPARRPVPPKDIETNEELYLTGLRVEQLYSPAADAKLYYEEALRRDSGDYRANAALALIHLKHGRYPEAEVKLRAAVRRATENYIRPRDGEAHYYLGVALRAQGKLDEARSAFWRSVWGAAWKAPGYLALAQLACADGNFTKANELADRSLRAEGANTKALALKAATCRKLGYKGDAGRLLLTLFAMDPLDFHGAWESYFLEGKLPQGVDRRMHGRPQDYLEIAVDYAAWGLLPEAMAVLQHGLEACRKGDAVHPMLHYYLGHFLLRENRPTLAEENFLLAASMPTDYCFPFRFEALAALKEATERSPRDSRAPYYLGNVLYDHQPEKAIQAWEVAIERDEAFALAHRNLGIAYAQARGDIPRAIASLERALVLDAANSRLYYELDRLYEEGNTPLEKRLEVLQRNPAAVALRDDATRRWIGVCLRVGKLDEALRILESRRFHNWEGRAELHGTYVDARLQRGQKRLGADKPKEALADFEAALEYPANLEVAKPHRNRRGPEIHYWIGRAREAQEDDEGARASYRKAVALERGSTSVAQYRAALAHQKLGDEDAARRLFDKLVASGRKTLDAVSSVDYFAKFGVKQSERARKANAHHLLGLGYKGLGKTAEAEAEFKKVIELDVGHLGARAELRQ